MRKLVQTIVLGTAAGLLPGGLAAYDIPVIHTVSPGVLKTGALEYFLDESRELDLIEARLAPTWETIGTVDWAFPTIGYTDDAVWFRFPLHNQSAQEMDFIFLVDYEFIDELEISAVHNDTVLWQRWQSRAQPFYTREFTGRNHAFHLNAPPGSTMIYLRLQSRHSIVAPLLVLSRVDYLERSGAQHLRMGVIFGAMILLFFAVFICYLVYRERAFVYYLAYLLISFLFMFTLTGFSFHYLWPNAPGWNTVAPVTIVSMLIYAGLLFTRRFLGTGVGLGPRMSQTLAFWGWLSLALPLLLLILPHGTVEVIVNSVQVPVAMFLMLAAGCLCLMRGFRAARFFVIGWGLYMSFVALYLLQLLAILPGGYVYSIDIFEMLLAGVLFEVLCFPVAIMEQMKQRLQGTIPVESVSPSDGQSLARANRLSAEDRQRLADALQKLMGEQAGFREQWTLRSLAGRAGVTEKQLSQYINEECSCNFYEYINRFRIAEATRLLKEDPKRKIIEVAYAVGFASLSTFQSAFQKFEGMAPGAYRRSLRE